MILIVHKPRPKYPYFPAPGLRGERTRMTLIGAIRCGSDVVLCADRQETIADYAKWDCSKIAHWETQGLYRVLMAGAGYSDLIEMVKENFEERWKETGSTNSKDLKNLAIESVRHIMKDVVLRYPKDERPSMDLIWAIQKITHLEPVTLFRTSGFHVNLIKKHYFTGNPILLSRFLSDMYLTPHITTIGTAAALAAYILWECKEYDPTVGKHSDIVSLELDGSLRRMSRSDEAYWEQHFYELKKAMQVLPVLSCPDQVIRQIYDPDDRMARVKVALDVLIAEQHKIREGKARDTNLGELAHETIKKDYQRREKARQSDAQTSEDQQ